MAIGAGNLGELIVSVGTDLSKLNSGLANASRTVQRVGKKMASDMEAAGRRMAITGVAIVGSVGLLTKGAGDFSQEMANVITLVDDFDGAIRTKFTAGVQNLASEFGESKIKLTKSLFDIQSATGDTANAMNILEASTKLAVGGNSDLVSSTSGLLTLMESYGDTLNGAADGADLLFKAQKFARATVGELAASVGDFLPIASQLNVSVEDSLAVYSQLTQALGNTSESATSLTGILNAFLKPTEELTAVIKTWKNEQTGLNYATAQEALQTEGLVGILKRLKTVNSENLGQLFPRVRAVKGLFSALSDLNNVEAISLGLRERSGSVDTAVAVQKKEFNRQVLIARENIAELFDTIGSQLLPTLVNYLKQIGPIIKNTIEWVKNNKELVANVVLGTAKFGAFLIVLGSSAVIFANVVRGLLFIISPMGVIISVIALLTTAWVKNWGNIREYTSTVARSVGNFIQNIIDDTNRMVLTFFELSKIPLKDKLLHPVQSLAKAMNEAEKKFQDMKEAGNINSWGDDFANNVDKAIDKTEEFKEKLSELGKIPKVDLELEEDKKKDDSSITDLSAEQERALMDLKIEEWQNEKALLEEKENTRVQSLKKSYNDELRFFSFKKRLQAVYTNAEKNHQQTRQALSQQTYDQFKSLLEQSATENKTAATILKGVRIGEAIVNTATGVTQALAAYPPPISFVMAGLVGAMGAAQIGLIQGAKFATGTDTVPSMLSPGETVIPRTFADAIRQGRLTLSGPERALQPQGSENRINIYMEDIKISSEVDIDTLGEELATSIKRKMR